MRQVDNHATVMTETNETKPITSNNSSFDCNDRNYIKTVANEGVLEVFRHIGVSCVPWEWMYVQCISAQMSVDQFSCYGAGTEMVNDVGESVLCIENSPQLSTELIS